MKFDLVLFIKYSPAQRRHYCKPPAHVATWGVFMHSYS